MVKLDRRRLGNTDMEITRVGVGTAPMGSTPSWKVYWGQQDERDAVRAIETAIELGINWIDTAPFYGWGRAEQIVGKALQGKRDKVYIFTKCGTLRNDEGGWTENLKPESIRREVETSLMNLQTDHIDLLQFHDPDPETPIEESWKEMQRLIKEGKIRHGGLSNHPVELLERAQTISPIASTQNEYNLLNREIENDILPFCERYGIGALSWGTLAEGFLTDEFDLATLDSNDFRRSHHYAQEQNYSRIKKLKAALYAIARARNRNTADLAIAWALTHPTLTGAIVGVRNEREAEQLVEAAGLRLTREELKKINETLTIWETN